VTGNLQLLDRPAPAPAPVDEEQLDIDVLFKEARRRQRRRRALATVGIAAVVIAMVASLLAVIGGAANRGTLGTQLPSDPIWTAVPAGAFAGDWSLHTSSVTIKPDGHGSIVYPFDVRCGSGVGASPFPCDTWVGNRIVPGGHAEIILTNVGKTTATGQIIGSNDGAIVPEVNIGLRLGSVYGVRLLYVSLMSLRPLRSFLTAPLCSPAARLYEASHSIQTAPLLRCGA
jgi:hypothetical protein